LVKTRSQERQSFGGSGGRAPGSFPMNRFLFQFAEFLSRPPGFYLVISLVILCTALVPFGLTDLITYALSVAAIAITGVVLIQGYRDTAAI
jgi:low affinity Fe/Cu permease